MGWKLGAREIQQLIGMERAEDILKRRVPTLVYVRTSLSLASCVCVCLFREHITAHVIWEVEIVVEKGQEYNSHP